MKKALLALAALTLVLAVAGSVLGCNNGTTKSTKPSNKPSSSPSNSPDPDKKVEFPVVYSAGKFMDGASAKTGTYNVGSGATIDGNVTLETDYINVTYTDGKNSWDDTEVLGYYTLKITFDEVDVTGYTGVEVEWEGIHAGPFQYVGINVDLIDAEANKNLALQTTEKTSPGTAKIADAAAWGGVQIGDFSYSVKEIDLAINSVKDSSGTPIPLANRTAWKVKSVKFYK